MTQETIDERPAVRPGDVVTIAGTVVYTDPERNTMTVEFWNEENQEGFDVELDMSEARDVIDHDADYEELARTMQEDAARPADPSKIKPDPYCLSCGGKGYLHTTMDDDDSRDWIARCDECQHYGDDDPRTAWDDDAAAYAAQVEGKTWHEAHPEHHDFHNADGSPCLHPYLT